MSILITAVIVLALLTAFAMGFVTGENAAREHHEFILCITEDEDDDEPDGAEEENTGID